MLDILTSLIQQYGNEAVVNNPTIPNENNEAVLQETGLALFSNLQKLATQTDLTQIAELIQSNNFSKTNPTIDSINQSVGESLSSKFGLSQSVASGAVSAMLPQILGSLFGKAKDPNDSSFNISDLLSSLTGGNTTQNSGILEAISKYGVQFGLDQNHDGKVNLDDAKELTNKGGISDILKNILGE